METFEETSDKVATTAAISVGITRVSNKTVFLVGQNGIPDFVLMAAAHFNDFRKSKQRVSAMEEASLPSANSNTSKAEDNSQDAQTLNN